jgi:membrane protein
MDEPARANSSPPARLGGEAATGPVRRLLSAARGRYVGSWVQAVAAELKALDFATWTTVFGAELLWSTLPLIILLGSLADQRVDDDLSRHIGLNSHGAHIVRGLFRNSPSHAVVPIVTGLLFSLAGTMAVVASLQLIYERVFDAEHRGWRDLPRYVVWVGGALGALVVGAIISSDRSTLGPVVERIVRFVLVSAFFAWTIRFLLAGRVPWRSVVRPALVTAFLWICLDVFSSVYFSSVVIDDNKTFGTIGVVFTFLTWFVLAGAVIMLGAAVGSVWQKRSDAQSAAHDRPRLN